jgi:hypothetical protein
LDPNGAAYRYLSRQVPRSRAVDPLRSPTLGGLAPRSGMPRQVDDNEKKKRATPSFYSHYPQWIMEPRTKYWGVKNPPTKGKNTPSSNPGQGTGGGYLPGGLFIGR